MMDMAKEAVKAAITFESKKDGLQQRQDGSWTLRLTIAGIDMDQRLTGAAMGTRYQCAIVQLDDDETPHDHKAEERSKWRDLGATRQSALRCKQPTFWAFMREVWEHDEVVDEETCAAAVREFCEIGSRSDLSKREFMQAQISWHRLDNAFQGWKAAEHG